jgi:hypothetical protein
MRTRATKSKIARDDLSTLNAALDIYTNAVVLLAQQYRRPRVAKRGRVSRWKSPSGLSRD